MARSAATAVENNFSKGLITQATGLNFPENACTETFNCVFEQTGQVRRRLGIDLESEGVTQAYTDSTGVIREYLWRAVARTGSFIFLVVQLGQNVVFYELVNGGNFSQNLAPFAVDLNDYLAPAASQVNLIQCGFASGNGRLFITHPKCDPIMVSYDEDTNMLEQTRITVRVRDFEGIEDNLEIGENPADLSSEHWYNLKNQGWYKDVRMVKPGGSAGPLTVGT